MKKYKKLTIITIIIICILILYVISGIYRVNPNWVELKNIQVNNTSVSFIFNHNGPPDSFNCYYLQRYKYDINNEGVLTINFYITKYDFLSRNEYVTIEASNIRKIDIVGKKGDVITIWEFED